MTKIKDLTKRLGELEIEDLGILVKFLSLVAELSEEDQKVFTDFFELLDKKIDENYVKKEENRR